MAKTYQGGGGYPQGPKKHKVTMKEETFLDDINRKFSVNLAEILKKEKKDYNGYIQCVKKYVEDDARDISASQLRNIFTKVKKAKEATDLTVLRPKIAYISGRTDDKKEGMKRLLFLLDHLIKQIEKQEQTEEFKKFFESIIAYHKYYGGKE